MVFPNEADARDVAQKLTQPDTTFEQTRRRSRPQGQRHQSRSRRQGADARPGRRRCRLRAAIGPGQRAGQGPLRHRPRQGRQDRAGSGAQPCRGRRRDQAQSRARTRAQAKSARNTTRSRTSAAPAQPLAEIAKKLGLTAAHDRHDRSLRPRPGRQSGARPARQSGVVQRRFSAPISASRTIRSSLPAATAMSGTRRCRRRPRASVRSTR